MLQAQKKRQNCGENLAPSPIFRLPQGKVRGMVQLPCAQWVRKDFNV
jgi:hypothetical protein